MTITIGETEILKIFNDYVIDNIKKVIKINGASTVNNPRNNTVLFMKKFTEDNLEIIKKIKDCCIFLHIDYKGRVNTQNNILVYGINPRLDFARFLQVFFMPDKLPLIAQTACIGCNVSVGSNVSIGEYSIIGDNVIIGDRTEIRHHVVVNSGTIIGSDCLIKSNTVIGEEGFGFERDAEGIPIRIPHIGGVVIGNGVEIGAGTVIAKGTIEHTLVEDNVKIDDQVFIAHNVRIGSNSFIVACSQVSGSTDIGENCHLGPNCSIMNGIAISDHCFIGLGSVVTKSLPNNVIVAGSPAKILRNNN